MTKAALELDIRHQDALKVLDLGAGLERLHGNFCFTEGPIWHPLREQLIFSDIICNSMYRWSEGAGLEVFKRPSYMANGNCFDLEGRILSCEHATSRLSRIADDGQGIQSYEPLVSHYQGKELNSPNDVVVRSDGAIFFTDPTSGRSEGYGVPRAPQLGHQGVYRLDPDSLELSLLVDDFSKPNGLCFSKDEGLLFVNDTDRQHIRVFDVEADGSLRNGRLWAETQGDLPGVPDGMKIDADENLFCCGPGGVQVFNRDAELLAIILMPEKTANFCWGDGDMRSLYITASTSLYRLRTHVPGKSVFYGG